MNKRELVRTLLDCLRLPPAF